MRKKIIYIILLSTLAFVINACSTKKNTAYRRFYHSTTAKYNIYFNGYESFKAGAKKIELVSENYTTILPIFKCEDENIKSVASSDMDLAVKKAVKAIKLHSITVKPKRKTGASAKKKEFYNKNEYNKYVDDAYLLIGISHYYKQDYNVAMKSLQLILNKFRDEPIIFPGTYWIARCYGALGDYKDAENYLKLITDNEFYNGKLDYEIELAYADLFIKQEQYQKAIEKLKLIIEKTHKKKKRARFKYILAQLYQQTGKGDKAIELYREVVKMNPPYDMAFSAKINMARSVGSDTEGIAKLKKELKKMLRDDKNIEYQDQIYYALADISLKEGDKNKALEYYKLSAERSVSNDNQKALSFLALGDLYFEKPDYLNSGAYYDSTMRVLDKKYPDYDKISIKANNLSELITNLKIVMHEDSMQRVAGMSETERKSFVSNIINTIKAEERAAEQEGQIGYDPFSQPDYNRNPELKGKWYFYNPQALSIGESEFKKLWGTRRLEDHWRRRNKTITQIENENEEEKSGVDSTGRVTDNKKEEYYLQDLPLTDSLINISNEKIAQALFNAGNVYSQKMKDYNEAVNSYETLLKRFPESNLVIEAYFNLYRINYNDKKDHSRAEYYRNKIIKEYPFSKYAQILSDPNYFKKLEETREKVSNLYSEAYFAFKDDNYNKVISSSDEAMRVNPQNNLVPKFWYLKSRALGGLQRNDEMKSLLKEIVEKYPDNEITPEAQATLDVINSGKFKSDYYQISDTEPHYYEIVLSDKKEIVNKIKYLLNNYNVDNYPEKKITIEEQKLPEGYMQIVVKSLNDRTEGMKYLNGLTSSPIVKQLSGIEFKQFIITQNNYEKLQKLPILDKYIEFYYKNY